MIELPWAEFKAQVLDTHHWNVVYFDINNHYFIYAKQNSFTVICKMHKDSGSDQADFEDNYKDLISNKITDNNRSRFEDEDIVLKLVKLAGQADGNGDLSLEVEIPGEAGEIGRYAAGFWAFTDNYAWGDAITKIEIIDTNGMLGEAGAVVKDYHDSDLSSENQGWFFWKVFGTEGECEVEPIGYYGQIFAGLTVRMTFKVQANAKVKVNGWWGKKE